MASKSNFNPLKDLAIPTYPPKAPFKSKHKKETPKFVRINNSVLATSTPNVDAQKIYYVKHVNYCINRLNIYKTCVDLKHIKLKSNYKYYAIGVLFSILIKTAYTTFGVNWVLSAIPGLIFVFLLFSNAIRMADNNELKTKIINIIDDIEYFKNVTLNLAELKLYSHHFRTIVKDIEKLSRQIDLSYLDQASKLAPIIDDNIDLEFAKLDMETK